MIQRRYGPLLASCLLGVVLGGCGGPRLAKVSGRVTVGGTPVPEGVILFVPESGPAAVGAIRPDGTYTLTTHKPGDGAVPGKHRVAIQATRVGAGKLVEPKSIAEEGELSREPGKVLAAGTVTWLVPEKYSRPETSGLTAEVQNGANTIPFDLPKP